MSTSKCHLEAERADVEPTELLCRFCAQIDRALDVNNVEVISDGELADVLTAATRLFAKKMAMKSVPPHAFSKSADIAATDVMVMTSAMLQRVNIQPFELAMWQSWSGWSSEMT